MANRNTEHHSEDVSHVGDGKCNNADLPSDIPVSVECCRANTFSPHNKDESQVVGPRIDSIQEVETELGAIHEGQKEGDDDDDGCNSPARELASEVGVANQSGKGLNQSKGRAETEDGEGQEEQDGPDVGTGHLGQGQGVCQEADGEGAERNGLVVWRIAQEANDVEDGEACRNLIKRVAARNDHAVLNGIGEFAVVGGVRREVSKAHANGEEDLSASALPDLSIGEFTTVPLTKVVLYTTTGIGKRGSASDEDN